MIAFDPTDDQKLMQETVASFAKTLRARLRETEKERAVAPDLRKTAHELGLGMVAVPEALGGAGLGLLTAALLEEELAYGDPAAPFGFGGPGALGAAVAELGTAEQAKALLAPFAGADAWDRFGAVAWGEKKASSQRAGLTTVAVNRMGTWELTGEKAYVVNADRASSFVVFAQTSEGQGWNGIGAFIVKKGTPGLTVLPRETSLGLDAALVRFFAKQSLVTAARALGLARAAFDIALEYCEQRRAFGKPIGHFQAVAFTLADRAMDVDAARGLVWRAAHAWDSGASDAHALLCTARAVSFAHEAAMRCGDDAVQLHGGAGFMRDYPVEKLMRDAKQLQVCTMTAEHCDQLAAAIELGRAYDPGDVLPTAESQSAFV